MIGWLIPVDGETPCCWSTPCTIRSPEKSQRFESNQAIKKDMLLFVVLVYLFALNLHRVLLILNKQSWWKTA